ncbi:hypothetical protein SteCoe_13356 [Stentor coeruleus]|uniref:Uncharacterized protein n=1 Tax=Stentor coeruleus TaxID=5963 RepID=A0A1R2C8I7_9CILI|nr:hypothetical protein SteCoe_13356 [Stentor coeruleus]
MLVPFIISKIVYKFSIVLPFPLNPFIELIPIDIENHVIAIVQKIALFKAVEYFQGRANKLGDIQDLKFQSAETLLIYWSSKMLCSYGNTPALFPEGITDKECLLFRIKSRHMEVNDENDHFLIENPNVAMCYEEILASIKKSKII